MVWRSRSFSGTCDLTLRRFMNPQRSISPADRIRDRGLKDCQEQRDKVDSSGKRQRPNLHRLKFSSRGSSLNGFGECSHVGETLKTLPR
ncbi:unnamed protein product [Caenorhabditis auriculariae]|uniref:Uncharacterized protein n=1 Tax=Caenorhabditis auriculariae TaxID=2777116 RepID=A0A8S1GVY1_9PELO|nr:unnamed protein product [Caenorhabditis auriculariae]